MILRLKQFLIDLRCWFLGHDYKVLKEYSPAVRKVGCSRCERVWGMNDRVKAFVPWDGELEEATLVTYTD